jgi:hypothetical protein
MTKRSYAAPVLACLGDVLALTQSASIDPYSEIFDQSHSTKNQ